MFSEMTLQESESVTGGSSANFDISSYSFGNGAGAIFDGGLTTNVTNIAFQQGLFTESPAPAPTAPTPIRIVVDGGAFNGVVVVVPG